MLGTGTLGDKVGHARMFATGMAIFGAASLSFAYAPTPELLIAARGALGPIRSDGSDMPRAKRATPAS